MNSRDALFRHGIYPLTDRIFRRDTFSAYQSIGELETMTRAQLERYQIDQVRELLVYCQQAIHYYRALFAGQGFRPETLASLDDLARIPPLTKALVREQRTALLSDRPGE